MQGRVTDERGLPLGGATVTCGTHVSITNEHGVFHFAQISLSKYFGYVKVSKPGYFTGSRTFVTSVTAQNFVQIKLIARIRSGEINAIAGGILTGGNGNRIEFSAESFIDDATHTPYAGAVTVYTAMLGVADVDLDIRMPGDLRGTDAENRIVGLQTFGMMAVELEGSSGQKLQLAPGKTATLHFPVSPSGLSSAPATIPMWCLNDSSGKWVEQGSAIKKGSEYVGTVSHFSYWNCDAPGGIIYFHAKLLDPAGNGLPYTKVEVTDNQTEETRSSFTDSLGNIGGWLIKNKSFTVNIYSQCGELLSSMQEGPFSADVELGNLTINILPLQQVVLIGQATDCNGKMITDGFATVIVAGIAYSTEIMNGNFSLTAPVCTNFQKLLQVFVDDRPSTQESDTLVFTATGKEMHIGELKACGFRTGKYINIALNNTLYTIRQAPDSIATNILFGSQTDTWAYAGIFNTSSFQDLHFTIPLANIGRASANVFYLTESGIQYLFNGFDSISCSITRFDWPYGYIKGSCSGNLYQASDPAGTPVPVSMSFQLKEW